MKKFLKQPLFWSTIVLGITTIVFAFATYALAERIGDMDSALSKYNMYYDSKDKDIYVDNSSSDSKTSDNSSSTEESSTTTSSSETETSYSSSSEETFDPNNYEVPDFATWNHDQLEHDKKIQITGTVVQNMEDDGIYYLRVAMDDDHSKIVMVGISKYVYDDVIAEDDNVTFYGVAKGLTSYESTLGKTVTLPLMYGHYYNINSYGN